jgi:hypothetical protein
MSAEAAGSGIERRTFLRVMGAGTAGAVAIAPLLSAEPAEAKEAADNRRKSRYRESDHVRKYYETNRF